MRLRNLSIGVWLVLAAATGARAQTPEPAGAPAEAPAGAMVDTRLPGRFLLGANLTRLVTPDGDIGGQFKVGGFFRFHPRQGWGPAFGLSWFRSDLRVDIDGAAENVGTLRVRPLMGGIGYTWVRGHTFVRAKAMGGYAFTSTELNEVLPRVNLKLELRETWVVQPSVDVTCAVARRLALVGSVNYTIARPMLRLTASDGVTEERASRRLRGDYLALTAGVAVSIF